MPQLPLYIMNPNPPRQAQVTTLELNLCATPACSRPVVPGMTTCFHCQALSATLPPSAEGRSPGRRHTDQPQTMSQKYPKYYKKVPKGLTELDVYATCMMFGVNDPSGAVHHAVKKLLLPGVRTGNKTRWDDIKEARDTLNRWLELNDPDGEPQIQVTVRT